MTEITITDLFEGAWLLTRGHELRDVTVHGTNGKTQCLFVFTGDGVEKAAQAYRSGDANVNVAKFKFAMDTLKGRMFSRLGKYNRSNQFSAHGAERGSYARKNRTQVTH